MREITREEHEMILNLFIICFMDWYRPESWSLYKTIADEAGIFGRIKDCFPMDEKYFDSYDANYIAWEII